ncbi:hypothetical protein K435DRAFT_845785 [Dendrothele bispora CBS 962.96]|uniref:Uncharacterized protein n=1 Tax=Dendrothele bispora (strain CBS 962.96) TaxID=1314807 RepID=A0A4S8KRZ0_DENBC|nr:hypothetical protein K435DRAFT_845785 [Dendrothele bispora CBS 962.96]
MTGAERKQQKNKHGGARAGSGRKPREVIVPEVSSDGVHVSGHNAHLPPHPIFTATRLASTTQSESNNNPGISVEINAPNLHSGSNAGNLFSDTNDSVPNSASRDQFLSESEWERLLAEQQQAKEVDPQTDGYGNYVNESVYDEVPALGSESLDDIQDSFGANEAGETMGIQTEYLATILTKLKDEIKNELPSRTLEDLWHVMHGLNRFLPRGHSAFKSFASKGIAWKTALRAKPDAIQKRIRYVCPPPERLAADLYKFFECWQDVICSKDPKLKLKLFNETARKQAAGIVEAARRGLLSDPPAKEVGPQTDGYGNYVDESVYDEVPALGSESLDDIPDSFGANEAEETMGIQTEYLHAWVKPDPKLKLKLFNDSTARKQAAGIVEAARRGLLSDPPALRASPEFADALLALIRHRRNQRVGFANRTGGTYRNHFENWTLDEIMELAAEVNVVTSFPQPNLLATRIETSEVFGIIPIPEQTTKKYDIRTATRPVIQPIIYYRDTPAHLRIHLSTAPLNAYVYLQQQQRTAHPVVPVHTHAEYKLFNEPIKTEKFIRVSSKSNSKNINFEKMALEWNHHVDSRYSQSVIPGHASALYYKLPEQLEQHHKVWAALLAENATLYNSEISRKEATAILTDSARYASTLPPTQLSTQKSRKGKEKAIEPQTDDLTTTLPFNDIEMADVFGTSPTNEDFMVEDSMETQDAQDASGSANVAIKTKTTCSLHSESVGSGSGSIKKDKKKAKRCGLCRDATCSQAEACPVVVTNCGAVLLSEVVQCTTCGTVVCRGSCRKLQEKMKEYSSRQQATAMRAERYLVSSRTECQSGSNGM